jgi:hypothetical protein
MSETRLVTQIVFNGEDTDYAALEAWCTGVLKSACDTPLLRPVHLEIHREAVRTDTQPG